MGEFLAHLSFKPSPTRADQTDLWLWGPRRRGSLVCSLSLTTFLFSAQTQLQTMVWKCREKGGLLAGLPGAKLAAITGVPAAQAPSEKCWCGSRQAPGNPAHPRSSPRLYSSLGNPQPATSPSPLAGAQAWGRNRATIPRSWLVLKDVLVSLLPGSITPGYSCALVQPALIAAEQGG